MAERAKCRKRVQRNFFEDSDDDFSPSSPPPPKKDSSKLTKLKKKKKNEKTVVYTSTQIDVSQQSLQIESPDEKKFNRELKNALRLSPPDDTASSSELVSVQDCNPSSADTVDVDELFNPSELGKEPTTVVVEQPDGELETLVGDLKAANNSSQNRQNEPNSFHSIPDAVSKSSAVVQDQLTKDQFASKLKLQKKKKDGWILKTDLTEKEKVPLENKINVVVQVHRIDESTEDEKESESNAQKSKAKLLCNEKTKALPILSSKSDNCNEAGDVHNDPTPNSPPMRKRKRKPKVIQYDSDSDVYEEPEEIRVEENDENSLDSDDDYMPKKKKNAKKGRNSSDKKKKQPIKTSPATRKSVAKTESDLKPLVQRSTNLPEAAAEPSKKALPISPEATPDCYRPSRVTLTKVNATTTPNSTNTRKTKPVGGDPEDTPTVSKKPRVSRTPASSNSSTTRSSEPSAAAGLMLTPMSSQTDNLRDSPGVISKSLLTPKTLPLGMGKTFNQKKMPAWTPPPRIGNKQTSPKSTTPSASPHLGLRVGLSRNARVLKPLHQSVKKVD